MPDVFHALIKEEISNLLCCFAKLKEVCQLLGVVKMITTLNQTVWIQPYFFEPPYSMAVSENERDWDLHITLVMHDGISE